MALQEKTNAYYIPVPEICYTIAHREDFFLIAFVLR